jgi:hypothetical protein
MILSVRSGFRVRTGPAYSDLAVNASFLQVALTASIHAADAPFCAAFTYLQSDLRSRQVCHRASCDRQVRKQAQRWSGWKAV